MAEKEHWEERWNIPVDDDIPCRPIRPKNEPKKESLDSPWFLLGGIVAGCLAGFGAALVIARNALRKK